MTRRRPPIVARIANALLFATVALSSLVGVAPVVAAPANGVTWTVDHNARTITAKLRLTLTPACSLSQISASQFIPSLGAQCRVTQEMADEVKANIEKIWNGHKYVCYDIVVSVDVTINNNPSAADPTDRVRVQLDQSSVNIRSRVSGTVEDTATWDGNTAKDRVTAENLGTASTTWRYPPDRPGSHAPNLYAHEAGHLLGLHDSYEDTRGPNGEPRSQLREGAPKDIMADTSSDQVDKSTSNRLAERAGVKKADLKCGWTFNGDTPIGQHRGVKCDGLGGEWTIQGEDVLAGAATITTLWNITINEGTLAGTYTHEKIQKLTGSVTTANANGAARIVVQADGSVLMTLDAAPITLKTVTVVGTKSVVVPGQVMIFPWENDTSGACP